jgi:phage shock protein PspC (stress-responsive transcriptional regulator)
MNKTLTINIGGIVFNIEVDAYDRLDNYLKDIKRHFTDSQGRDEIMADIESRIAEMFQEKVGKTKSVLILEDVERAIRIMGNPEEFSEGNHESKTESAYSANYNKQEYMGYRRRRVYRDADDRVIGGVCSGIANYFDLDPLWIRLALAASFFIFGSGFLLYLILWIAIPEAKTTAEKLEMRGEPINVDNIKKSFNEEFEKVNESSKQFGQRAKHMGNDAADFITNLAGAILKFAAKAIGIFFIIFGVFTLAVLMASLFSDYSTIHIAHNNDMQSYNFRELMLMFFNDSSEINLAILGIFLMVGIPLLMIIYKGVRLIFKIKERNRIASITASILFLLGLSISVYVMFDIAQDFQTPAKQVQKITLKTPSRNILYVQTDLSDKYDADDELDDDNDNDEVNIHIGKKDGKHVQFNDEGISFSSPEFDVVASKTDSFELVLIRTARGSSKKIAYERAGNFNYSFSQADSVLNLSNYFNLSKNEKWRAQDLKVVLRVPRGKQVYLSKSLRHIIYDIDNVTNTHDSKMMNRRWVMNADGLTCVDCDGINNRKNRHLSDEDDTEETDF